MSEKIKEVKGQEKKIWILSLKPHSSDTIFSESKMQLLALWDLLESGSFKMLSFKSEGYDFEDKAKFYYPKNFRTELTTKTVYLHADEEGAVKSNTAYLHAKKVGLISKKKKKS